MRAPHDIFKVGAQDSLWGRGKVTQHFVSVPCSGLGQWGAIKGFQTREDGEITFKLTLAAISKMRQEIH